MMTILNIEIMVITHIIGVNFVQTFDSNDEYLQKELFCYYDDDDM